MIYVFDIDDTICTTPKSEQNDREADYESATPKVDRKKKLISYMMKVIQYTF